MQRVGWLKTIGVGLLIGLVASIVMTLAMMALRYGLGGAIPSRIGRRSPGTGTIQTAMDRSFAPEGASGYHNITVRAEG